MGRTVNLSEAGLRTDLNEFSGEILHELHVFFRKAGIYSNEHPMVRTSVSHPFLLLQRFFGFKKYFTIFLTEERLFANNILMDDSASVDYIKANMRESDITSLMLADDLTVDELLIFAGRFVRLPNCHPTLSMQQFLDNYRFQSILINHPLALKLFDTGLRYRSDSRENFSVRRIVSNYFSGDIDLAMRVLNMPYVDVAKQATETGIDFHPEIISYILPEKFSQRTVEELLEAADRILSDDSQDVQAMAAELARLVRSLDYHPKRDTLIAEIQSRLKNSELFVRTLQDSLHQAEAVKLETTQAVDHIKDEIFSDKVNPELYSRYYDAFLRVLRTRQTGKAASITADLVDYLASDKSAFRQRAVALIKDSIKAALSISEYELLDTLGQQVMDMFARGRDTFEFSEVITCLLKSILLLRRYESAAKILTALRRGCRMQPGEMIYDTVTLNKIFSDLNDNDLIARLVRELQHLTAEPGKVVGDILAAIQSKEVALQLANIVAHPDRIVRQRCLKVLVDLGQPALAVFSDILREETNFYRPDGRHELPDEKWFLVRNAIFIMGNLGDPVACHALRLRLSDPDSRVRLEIVRALEKINKEEAADLLMVLAEDRDHAVCEAAIIALGLSKRSDLIPFFIDLLNLHKEHAIRIITAIAQTGSSDGRDFLINLLDNKDKLKAVASGKASTEELRALLIQLLEKIGDDVAIGKLEELRRDSRAGEPGLSKTARLLLSKIAPKK